MFVLFKKRDFSDLISDTFAFFKTNGKHFFRNYFLINGGLLVLFCALLYFVFKIYFEASFAGSGTLRANYLSQYFNNNMGLFAGTFSFFLLLIIVISLLNVAYPVLYLQLLDSKKGAEFTTAEIIDSLKDNVSKMIKFFIGFVFIIMPIMMVIFMLLILLCVIIIGIPMLMIAIPTVFAWLNLSFYTYLTEEEHFFTSLKKGYSLLKQQFWTVVGATFIMLLLIQFIQTIITMIPYFFGTVLFFTSANTGAPDAINNIGFLTTSIFILGVLMSALFNNMIIVNQGITYYSLREETENNSSESQIDLIGIDNE